MLSAAVTLKKHFPIQTNVLGTSCAPGALLYAAQPTLGYTERSTGTSATHLHLRAHVHHHLPRLPRLVLEREGDPVVPQVLVDGLPCCCRTLPLVVPGRTVLLNEQVQRCFLSVASEQLRPTCAEDEVEVCTAKQSPCGHIRSVLTKRSHRASPQWEKKTKNKLTRGQIQVPHLSEYFLFERA